MNREILFRGKRVDNEEWVEGVPVKVNTENKKEKCFIVQAEFKSYDIFIDFLETSTFEVIPSTVGQYTGLTDKNGVKIFEEDIVTGTAYSFERVGVVVWIDEIAGFGIKYRKREEAAAWENTSILKHLCKGRNDQFAAAVIGNVHDNPELMKGEENV